MNKYVLFYFSSVILSTVSQILLKISAEKDRKTKIAEYLNTYVITAYLLLLVSLFVVSVTIKNIQTSFAPIIDSTAYVLVLFAGKIIFKEKITVRKIVGSIFIIAGVIIFGL